MIIALFMIGMVGMSLINVHDTNQTNDCDEILLSEPNDAIGTLLCHYDFNSDLSSDAGVDQDVVPYGGSSLKTMGGVNDSGYLEIPADVSAYAVIPYASVLDGYGFTVEVWFRSYFDFAAPQNILSKEGDNGPNYAITRLPHNDTHIGEIQANATTMDSMTMSATANDYLQNRVWHYACLIVDSMDITLYVDGSYEGSHAETNMIQGGMFEIELGTHYSNVPIDIDEITISTGALDSYEIYERYDNAYQPEENDDEFEENDAWTTEVNVNFNNNTYLNLYQKDEDHYGIEVAPDKNVSVIITSESDLSSLEIWTTSSVNGERLTQYYAVSNNQIAINFLTGINYERYYWVVDGNDQGIQYNMTITIQPNVPVTMGDDDEDDDNDNNKGASEENDDNPFQIDGFPMGFSVVIASMMIIGISISHNRKSLLSRE